MFDDRQMRHLETQVDALRMKQKDSATRKTYDQVFDQAALLTIASLISDGVISTLDYPVSTGKEANVFHATDAAGRAKAQKEYKNLVRMEDAGVRVPTPERVLDNVLVMAYIGDESTPAPSLREVALESPAAVYQDVVANLRAIRKSRLVHADMSEYNLLWWQDRVVVIDVGQAVPLDHPHAEEWFRRDVANIARFFKRLRVDTTPASLEQAILQD